ncbi:hypothetical protein ACWCPX_30515 [Streptomyces olivaceoviridis]
MIFQAGDCGEGRDFAARNADVIFCAQGTDFDDAAAFADGVRRRLRAGAPRTICGSCPVVGENDGSFGARRVAHPRAVVAEWRTKAEARGWSVRETVIALGPRREHVGAPSGLADRFAHFVRRGAIDGFTILPYLIRGGLGRHRRPARAGTRGTRGLPHRVHRHHAPRTPRSARTTPPPVRAGPAAGGLGLGRVLVHMADRNPYT